MTGFSGWHTFCKLRNVKIFYARETRTDGTKPNEGKRDESGLKHYHSMLRIRETLLILIHLITHHENVTKSIRTPVYTVGKRRP